MPLKNYLIAASTLLLLFLAVSASVTEKFLQIPLLEVGGLWVQAVETVASRLLTSLCALSDLSSPWTYIIIAVLGVFLYGCYILLFRPWNCVRKLGDCGYLAEGSFSVKETANLVQKRRKVGNTPPPYPDGWFGLMESFSLKAGEAKTVSALGQNLAVFRDQAGTAHVLDAYCPHMGANLAAGGRVQGDCIECPFHAWKFRGHDGKCVSIPYTDKIPEIARVKSWPVREVTGWIFVWHHAEGLDPSWSIPIVEEIENNALVYRGRTEHYINAHIEEISENSADLAHFQHVHGPIIAAGTNLTTMWSKRWALAEHGWAADWEPMPEPNGHIGFLKLNHDISLFGFVVPMLNFKVTAKQIGPAVVYMEFESFLGKGIFVHTFTPQSPLVQKVVQNVFFSRRVPVVIARLFLMAESIQFERDIMIWNNKQHNERTLFVKSKEDALILKHRRWYSQFYSKRDNSSYFQKAGLDF
ncbi:hypothetical protein BsWGS_23661 [Bradybaena similaris]